ncbi:hypothetical protein PRIPAC_90257 [Pristionchus pacificus]|nr:hypothetical protein PRIPAC_90257 [Pristionchus pacificus]
MYLGIFIPVFADQPRNAGMMEFNGFGKVFNKHDLADTDKLTATIKEVLENKKYRNNAQRISKMLAKKPFSSKQQLIKYVEFAAEFGPSDALRPQSIDMNFIEYHNMDIIFVAFLFNIVQWFLLYKLALLVIRKFRSTPKSKNE